MIPEKADIYFADDILKYILVNKIASIRISKDFAPQCPIDDKSFV